MVSALSAFVQPFYSPAIHQLRIFVPVHFEQPEAVRGKPVIVVAVENHRIVRRNASVADQFFKGFLADDVAPDLILKLRLPVEAGRAGNVAGVVGFGINVDLDQLDAGFAEILFYPIGRDQHFGVSIVCHRFLSSLGVRLGFRPPGSECVSPYWTCI